MSDRGVKAYGPLGLDRTLPSAGDLIALMAKEPRLIRRPIVAAGTRVTVGFDPAAFAER